MPLITSTTYNLTGLTAGTLYNTEVRAVDTSGNEGPGALGSFTTAFATHPIIAMSPYFFFETRQQGVNVTAETRNEGGGAYTLRYTDRSANARHLSQATAINQPKLFNAGMDTAYHNFSADSNSAFLTGAHVNDLLQGSFTMFFYVDMVSFSGVQILLESGVVTASVPGISLFLSSTGVLTFRFKQTAADAEYRLDTTYGAVGAKQVICLKVDRAAKQMTLLKGGAALPVSGANTGTMPTADTVLPNITAPLHYMNRGGSALQFRGPEHAVVAFPRLLTAQETTDVLNYFTY